MAKKRTSLKDKNIFKRTKALEDLIGSSNSEAEKGETMAEEKRSEESGDLAANSAASNLPLTSDVSSTSEAEGEIPMSETPPLDEIEETEETNETEIDLLASLSAEATVATETGETDPDTLAETDLGTDLDFPPALETPPVGEADLGFPPALETPPADETAAINIASDLSNAEDLPAGEAEIDLAASLNAEATIAAEDDSPILAATDLGADLDFPPALETPPVGEADLDFPPALETSPAEDLPVGEAAMASGAEFVDDFPAAIDAIDDPLNFPPALESEPKPVGAESLPSGEAGLEAGLGEADFNLADTPAFGEPASSLDLGLDDFSNTPITAQPMTGPLNRYESTASSATDFTARPASSPTNGTPASSTPTSTGSFAVSRMTPLTFDDDSAKDIFDFMGVADEPETIQYQIPDDIEELTPEERKRRMSLLKDDRIKEQYEKVYKAIDELYEQILDVNISSNKFITDWAHNLLAETRFIVMNYRTDHLAKAEYNIQQVKARLDRATESEKEQRKWARPLAIWGVIWFLIFVTMIFNPAPLSAFLTVTDDAAMSQLLLIPEIFLRTIFFGGLGGVTAVFYSLLKYVSERRYDKEHNVSYVFKPIMGMVMGTLIYLLIFVVSRVLGFAPPAVINTTNPEAASNIQIFAILTYFSAMAAGFKENVAFQLLSRMMKVIFRDDREKSSDAASAPPPASPLDS